MSKEKKITDEQLEKEIKDGKSQKEIAFKYGFGYPSGPLSERAEKLGYRFNSKFTLQNWGGATISLDSGTLEKAQELSGVNTFEEEGRDKLFKHNQVVEDPDDFELREGDIVLRLSDRSWRKIQ